jgi:N-acyl-D-aspartate/D-glutamate deacylase
MPLGVNIAQLVPVTPLVSYVMRDWNDAKERPPSAAESAEIARLLHEAMDAGAIGWSSQRQPPESLASFQRDYDGTADGGPTCCPTTSTSGLRAYCASVTTV